MISDFKIKVKGFDSVIRNRKYDVYNRKEEHLTLCLYSFFFPYLLLMQNCINEELIANQECK